MPIFRFRTHTAAYAAQQMVLGMIRHAGHLTEPDRAARLHNADPERPCILEFDIDPESPLARQIAQRLEDAPDPAPVEVARRTLQVIRRGWRRYGDDDPPRQVDPVRRPRSQPHAHRSVRAGLVRVDRLRGGEHPLATVDRRHVRRDREALRHGRVPLRGHRRHLALRHVERGPGHPAGRHRSPPRNGDRAPRAKPSRRPVTPARPVHSGTCRRRNRPEPDESPSTQRS